MACCPGAPCAKTSETRTVALRYHHGFTVKLQVGRESKGIKGDIPLPLVPASRVFDLCRLASNSGYRCIGVWCASTMHKMALASPTGETPPYEPTRLGGGGRSYAPHFKSPVPAPISCAHRPMPSFPTLLDAYSAFPFSGPPFRFSLAMGWIWCAAFPPAKHHPP